MTTHFISLEINLPPSAAALQSAVVTELQKYGDPLRWAITRIDRHRQTAQVEAIVTTHHA